MEISGLGYGQAKYASPFYGQYGEVVASDVLEQALVRVSASYASWYRDLPILD